MQLSDKTERSLDPVALRGFWGVILAQFFGVFNDNALKWFLQALSIRTVTETSRRDFLVALAGALFLGPYLFFSTHAGCVADRFSKRHVLLVSKCTEVGIMALGIAVFELRREDFLPWLLALLFLLGCQSTYYAPAKYGILPQLLPVSLLSWGNGLLEFTGFLAIIAGTIAGAHFVGWFDGAYHFALLVFTAVAVFGVAASLWVPRVPAIAPQRRLQLNPCPLLARHGRLLLRHRGLLFSILGVVFIWSLGLLFQLNIALYAKEHLAKSEAWFGYPMAVIALGVALGSFAAARLSGRTIELGLVLVGATGISFASLLLLLTVASSSATLLVVGGIGFFSGFLIVPLHAYLQAESPTEEKGGMMATANFFQTAGMFLATGVFLVFRNALHLSPATIFCVTGIGTMVLTLFGVRLLPSSLARLALWGLTHSRYRLDLRGAYRLEAPGPLLVLGSRLTFLETLLALTATHRELRVIYCGAAARPASRFIGRLLGAERVAPANGEDPRPQAASLAREQLQRGTSVFLVDSSEGGVGRQSATAELATAILDGVAAVVVPVRARTIQVQRRHVLEVSFDEA